MTQSRSDPDLNLIWTSLNKVEECAEIYILGTTNCLVLCYSKNILLYCKSKSYLQEQKIKYVARCKLAGCILPNTNTGKLYCTVNTFVGSYSCMYNLGVAPTGWLIHWKVVFELRIFSVKWYENDDSISTFLRCTTVHYPGTEWLKYSL